MAGASFNTINGINYPSFIEQKKLDELADFPLQSDDLFIATYPKSGTVWSLFLTSSIKSSVNVGGGGEASRPLSPLWLEREGKEAGLAMSSSRLLMSHLPYHMMPGGEPIKTTAKYIYIARNPKDVAVSFYYHTLRMKEVEPIEWNDFFELFISGRIMFGSWFDHVLEWWKHRDADNILFLKYEDMKKDLPGCVKNISQFMGYNLDESVIAKIAENSTFDGMKNNPFFKPDESKYAKMDFRDNSGTFLRKGIVGDWRNHFSDEQSARLDAEYAKRMTGNKLDFEF